MKRNFITKIRYAEESDIDLYFQWVNEFYTRKNSVQSELINLENHQDWFRCKLQDEGCYLYVLEACSVAIGQVRFDLVSEVSTVSFSLDVAFRGKGIGREQLRIAMLAFIGDCQDVKFINAVVKTDNIASNKIFSSFGFCLYESNQNLGLNEYRIAISELVLF